ncbi:MAG: flagellar biosynthesis anti-sigma factor FlgM [Bacteriovoracaceae bacterium]|nr:flagellar biosynthesis anti-sigma factor FlgM [Bacteriovoracaceae bacterium]
MKQSKLLNCSDKQNRPSSPKNSCKIIELPLNKKLNIIKKQIKEGTYHINLDSLAEKIMKKEIK